MEASNGQVEKLKLFVGGLSWETDKAKLKKHFEKYGPVTDSVVMIDKETGKPRGFGFVTFEDEESLQKALDEEDHQLDGKKIDPKRATAKVYPGVVKSDKKTPNKIFAGGLPTNVSEDIIRKGFSDQGTMIHLDIKKTKEGRLRGFAFVEYEETSTVKKLIADHYLTIGDKQVEIKEAQPRGQYSQVPANPSAGHQGGNFPHQSHQQSYTSYPTYNVAHAGYDQAYGQQQYYGGVDYSSYYDQGYGQTNQSYGGSGQQVAASVPGQQVASYQTTHSYGSAGGRGAAGAYSNTSEGYATSGSYGYHQEGPRYDGRSVASFSQQRSYDYNAS